MVIKYASDFQGVCFYTDEPLNVDEVKYKNVLDTLNALPGVEIAKAGKYFLDVLYGMLFDADKVCEEVINCVKQLYGVEITKVGAEGLEFILNQPMGAPSSAVN